MGLDRLCPEHEVIVPRMRPRGNRSSSKDRDLNQQFSTMRIAVENMVCNMGKLRICREFYRNDTRRYGRFWGCVVGLVNFRTVNRSPQLA
ncbi:hypothetical protein GCM10010841_26850 [Deinococcus aerophilus]|uniref:DDE Tnp4 domain-containing protein n=1 Tax=Deinococcus aerophilus TaxID=522488 RepID=A0ABQ2GWJ8_9DEIO|nr:hypothetical protein GCM10010841_26850 [Deinococcus aerophilus]